MTVAVSDVVVMVWGFRVQRYFVSLHLISYDFALLLRLFYLRSQVILRGATQILCTLLKYLYLSMYMFVCMYLCIYIYYNFCKKIPPLHVGYVTPAVVTSLHFLSFVLYFYKTLQHSTYKLLVNSHGYLLVLYAYTLVNFFFN